MTVVSVFDDPRYVTLEAARLGGRETFFDLGTEHPLGLIAREIAGQDLSDLVSIYGYPDFSGACQNVDAFLTDFAAQATERGQIAAYLRLGLGFETPAPSLDLDGVSAVRVDVGEVVAVDLALDLDQILAGYRKNLRYDLRQPHGLTMEQSTDTAAFHEIYTENMSRVGATETYFFTEDYLASLVAIPGVELWLARDGEGVVAGGIFLRQSEIVYYHLGATADRALRTSPMKHVLHQRIANLSGAGLRYLVLGGGVGGGEDALLRFKRGFSKTLLPVHALRVVLDPPRYSALCGVSTAEADGFFPAYRSNQ